MDKAFGVNRALASDLRHAAVDEELDGDDEAGSIRAWEGDGLADLFGLAQPAQRHQCGEVFKQALADRFRCGTAGSARLGAAVRRVLQCSKEVPNDSGSTGHATLQMTEREFIEAIDCRLPYGDLAKVRSIIEQAKGISPNAEFMVLHEICRPPRGKKLGLNARLMLLQSWAQTIEHPLNTVVLPIAESMVRDQDVPVDVAMVAMREVARFPNQFNALAIPYFSCDDQDGEVDALHRSITLAWADA